MGYLDIKYNKISSLDGLQNCTALQYLGCYYNDLSSLDGLQYCKDIQTLYISSNNISSLNGLQNCVALQTLYISYNNLIALFGLENCTALQTICCNNNNISSLDGLENCTALQKLDISENNINSLDVLQNCTALQALHITWNNINSLDGLQNCTALRYLHCNNNKLTSLDGLQNCTDLRRLNISYNRYITTLPNFLIEFRQLQLFSCYDLELELDARQRRWLNHIRNRQRNTNNIQVYGNSQNVHDSSIQESVISSMSRLLNQSLIPSYNVNTITDNIVLDTVLTPKSKDQLLSYISSQEELVELFLTYGDLLWTVWQTIHNLGEFNEETQNQIKQILNQELEDSDCKCFTGRMTRLVNVLNGFSPLVEVKILDGVQIGNIVAIIKQRLERSQDGYTLEKHREEFRKEMLDRGESVEVINEWLEYIE